MKKVQKRLEVGRKRQKLIPMLRVSEAKAAELEKALEHHRTEFKKALLAMWLDGDENQRRGIERIWLDRLQSE